MSTRGNIIVQDRGQNIVRIYCHSDAHPSWLGAKLKDILGEAGPYVGNGHSGHDTLPEYCAGMECLAAYLVGQAKGDRVGGIYLHPPDGPVGWDIEYVYTLYAVDTVVHIRVESGSVELYDGPFAEFDPVNLEGTE